MLSSEGTIHQANSSPNTFGWKVLCVSRQLYGLYFFLGGCFKFIVGLLWSDTLKKMFLERLVDIPENTFAHDYLTDFAIPHAFLIAYILTIGELAVGFLYMKNLEVKWASVLALFITINIAIGGFFSWILVVFIVVPFFLFCTSEPKIGIAETNTEKARGSMTKTERDELNHFLRDLHQTRLPCEEGFASSMIRERVATHPQAHYAMALRCILLEKELTALKANLASSAEKSITPDQNSPVVFLNTTSQDWGVNSKSVPKAFSEPKLVSETKTPAHLLLEEKAINFLGDNALKVWAFIFVLAAVVVVFRR